MAEPVPDESGVSLRFPRNAERGVEETLHPAFVRLCVYTSKYSATIAAELATAGIQLSQRRQAARDDAVFNELIARLDEEDDDSDG